MMCGKYEKLYYSGAHWGSNTPMGIPRDWGSWGEYKYCPTGMAICGLQTKVQHWVWNPTGRLDNTGLNRVRFYCCYLLNYQDNCLVLKVEHINHWRDGESGRYFYFSEKDLTQKIGPLWGGTGGTKFEVTQERNEKEKWRGQVQVWKHWSGVHGRRVSGSSAYQWRAGDTIKFKSC